MDGISFLEIIISIIVVIITTAITFFLKDQLQRYLDYKKLKAKLANVAGVAAYVIYGGNRYRIGAIDRHGILLESDAENIFIPINRALENTVTIPSDDYDQIKRKVEEDEHEKVKARMLDAMDSMFPNIL